MTPERYKNMLATLKEQCEKNVNKIYPETKHYPRTFNIIDRIGNPIAKFFFANMKDGYRYQTDKGGLSREYVSFDIVKDIFKYFKTEKFD